MKLGRLRGPVSASALTPSGGRWNLEVQIHPSDIRRKVRYLFLSRWQVTALSILALLYVAGVAVAVAVAPGVVGGLLGRQEYQGLTAERTRQGERLQELVDHVDQLDHRAGDLGVRMEKVFLAYGLPPVPMQTHPRPAGETGPASI